MPRLETDTLFMHQQVKIGKLGCHVPCTRGGISTIYLQYLHYIYRHRLPIAHCTSCMMSVFCLLPASTAVQFVACAHLPITGAEEQILSCLEIITTRLIFTTSGPLLENIQTPPIWRQRTRRRNKEKFSREKLHCN